MALISSSSFPADERPDLAVLLVQFQLFKLLVNWIDKKAVFPRADNQMDHQVSA